MIQIPCKRPLNKFKFLVTVDSETDESTVDILSTDSNAGACELLEAEALLIHSTYNHIMSLSYEDAETFRASLIDVVNNIAFREDIEDDSQLRC